MPNDRLKELAALAEPDDDRVSALASLAEPEAPEPAAATVPRARRTPRVKPGARIDRVNPDLLDFAAEHDAVVTSGTDSLKVHMPGSRHGDGDALDLRTRDKTPAQIRQMQEAARARGFNATYERAGQGRATGDHLHVSRSRGGQRAPVRPARPEQLDETRIAELAALADTDSSSSPPAGQSALPPGSIETTNASPAAAVAPTGRTPGSRPTSTAARWAERTASAADAEAEALVEAAVKDAATTGQKLSPRARQTVESNLPADLEERLPISITDRVSRGEKPNSYRVVDEQVEAQRQKQLKAARNTVARAHSELKRAKDVRLSAEARRTQDIDRLRFGSYGGENPGAIADRVSASLAEEERAQRRYDDARRQLREARASSPQSQPLVVSSDGAGSYRSDAVLQDVDAGVYRAAAREAAERAETVNETALREQVRRRIIFENGGEENLTRIKRDALLADAIRAGLPGEELEKYVADRMGGPHSIDRHVEEQTAAEVERLKQTDAYAKELAVTGRPADVSDWWRDLKSRPTQLVPFVGSLPDIANLLNLRDAAARLERGEADEQDKIALREFRALNQTHPTVANRILSIVTQLPAFAGELALTSGGYGAVKEAAEVGIRKALTREGVSLLERKAGESLAARAAKRAGEFGVKAGGALAGSAVQTPMAGSLRVVQGANERMLTRGEDAGTAFGWALVDQFIETATEHAGGVTEFIPGVNKLSKGAKRFTRPIERAGVHDIIGEMTEERLGELARAIVGLQPNFTLMGVPLTEYATAHGWAEAGKQLVAEAVGFSVPGAASAAAAGFPVAQDETGGAPVDNEPAGIGQDSSSAPAADQNLIAGSGAETTTAQPLSAEKSAEALAQNLTSNEVENQASPNRNPLGAVRAGAQAVTVVPQGTKIPAPLRSFKDFDGNRVVYNPGLVEREEVVAAMDAGSLDALNAKGVSGGGSTATGTPLNSDAAQRLGITPEQYANGVTNNLHTFDAVKPNERVMVNGVQGYVIDRLDNDTLRVFVEGEPRLNGLGGTGEQTVTREQASDPFERGVQLQRVDDLASGAIEAEVISGGRQREGEGDSGRAEAGSPRRVEEPRPVAVGEHGAARLLHGSEAGGAATSSGDAPSLTEPPAPEAAPAPSVNERDILPQNSQTEEPAHHSAYQPRDTDGTFVPGRPVIPDREEARGLAKTLRERLEGASKEESGAPLGKTDSTPAPAIPKSLNEAQTVEEVDAYVNFHQSSPMRQTTDSEMWGKRMKALGMEAAARKRQITGELTAKEQRRKDERAAGNYTGKRVSVAGVNGVVAGNPFGRVKVRFEDGTARTVDASEVAAPVEVSQNVLAADAHGELRRAIEGASPDAEPTFRDFPEGMSESRVPRSSMPQIKSQHRGALVQFLKGRDITHEQVEVDPRSLKPSQRDYSPEKVAKAKTFEGPDRSILISSDGYVLDGHHGWLSHLDDETVPAIRLDAPIQQLLVEAARFPSSGVDDAGATTPVKESKSKRAPARRKADPSVDSLGRMVWASGGMRADSDGTYRAELLRIAKLRPGIYSNSGMSVEAMATHMAELGYPVAETGYALAPGQRVTDVDPHVFLEMVEDDLRGVRRVHSSAHEIAQGEVDALTDEQREELGAELRYLGDPRVIELLQEVKDGHEDEGLREELHILAGNYGLPDEAVEAHLDYARESGPGREGPSEAGAEQGEEPDTSFDFADEEVATAVSQAHPNLIPEGKEEEFFAARARERAERRRKKAEAREQEALAYFNSLEVVPSEGGFRIRAGERGFLSTGGGQFGVTAEFPTRQVATDYLNDFRRRNGLPSLRTAEPSRPTEQPSMLEPAGGLFGGPQESAASPARRHPADIERERLAKKERERQAAQLREAFDADGAEVERLSKSDDKLVRSVAAKLLERAPELRARDGAGAEDLTLPLKNLADLREQGVSVDEYERQGSMFGQELSPEQMATLRAFASGHAESRIGQLMTVLTNSDVPDVAPEPAIVSPLKMARAAVTETPEFKQRFGASKVVDESGAPLKVYHATDAPEDFSSFSRADYDVGIHFGSAGVAAARLEWKAKPRRAGDAETREHHRIIPAYLRIDNPLRLAADPTAWDAGNLPEFFERHAPHVFTPSEMAVLKKYDRLVFEAEKRAAREHRLKLDDIETDEAALATMDRYRNEVERKFSAKVVALLKAKGYDGIIYQNDNETTANGIEPSYAVFDPEQIILALGGGGVPGGDAGGSAVTASYIPTPEEATQLKRKIMRQLKSLLSGNTLASGLYPAHVVAEIMPDLARLGAYHLSNGATTFRAFAGRMVDDLGDAIEPHLRKIFAEAKKLIDGEAETIKDNARSTTKAQVTGMRADEAESASGEPVADGESRPASTNNLPIATVPPDDATIPAVGMTVGEVYEAVVNHLESLYHKDEVQPYDLAIVGSQIKGTARADSDLDVVVWYGSIEDFREDDVFSYANDDENALYLNGVRVDINPIREDGSGTLDEWLERHGYERTQSLGQPGGGRGETGGAGDNEAKKLIEGNDGRENTANAAAHPRPVNDDTGAPGPVVNEDGAAEQFAGNEDTARAAEREDVSDGGGRAVAVDLNLEDNGSDGSDRANRKERSFPKTLEAAGLEGGDDRTYEPTGPKNEITERERAERGLAPVERQAYTAVGDAYLRGREAVESGGLDPRRLAETIARSPRPLSVEEIGALVFDRARLKDEHGRAVDDVARAVDSGAARAAAEGRDRLALIEHDFDLNDQALQKGGREQSAAFNARKMLVLADYSLAATVARAKAKKGAEIDEETRAKLEELTRKLEYTEGRLDNARRTIQGLEAERVVKHLNREVRRERRKVAREELDKEFDELSAMFGKLASRPHMAAFAVDPEMVKIIGRMAKNRVQAGVNTLDGLVDNVHAALSDHFDDLDKRDVRDWISGYGVTEQLSQEEADRSLRELKRMMRLASAIEDAEAGERPLKSGLEREPDSLAVAGMRRELAEAMRAAGLVEPPPPKQGPHEWLSGAKERLQKQITDLEEKLAAGDFLRPEKREPLPLDEEGRRLKAERDRLRMAVEREIARQERTGALDTVTNFRRANLLTAVKSHLRNVSSNTIFQATEELSRPAAALGDMLAARRTGARTTFGLDIPAAARATLAAVYSEGPRRAADYILGREVLPLEGLENAGAESQAAKAQLEASNTGFRPLDLYVNTVFNTLQAEDAIFKVYAFRRELSDIARAQATAEARADRSVNLKERARELRANPADWMLVEAAAYADYATFQNPNKVSAGIAEGKRLLGPVGKFAIEQIAPFDRTPTNIILRALENSPVGLISAAHKWRQMSKSVAARTVAGAALTRAEQKEFARTFGRAATGTALTALAMALAGAGLLAGAIDYDDDPDEYREKKRAFGGGAMLRVPGTSLRIYIGDTPVGKAMATAAAMWEALDKPSADEKVAGIARAAKRVALDQPLVKGLNDVAETESAAEGMGAYARSFVPASSMMEQVGEVVDDKPRKFFRGKDKEATFGEKFLGQVRKAVPPPLPGSRAGLPENPNVDEAERGGIGRRLLRSLDPFNTTHEKEAVKLSPVARAAFDEIGKSPYEAPAKLKIGDRDRILNAEERAAIERGVRTEVNRRVEEFFNPTKEAGKRLLDRYETAPPEEKKKILDGIQTDAARGVRERFTREYLKAHKADIERERAEQKTADRARRVELIERKEKRGVITPEEARRAVERLRGNTNAPR